MSDTVRTRRPKPWPRGCYGAPASCIWSRTPRSVAGRAGSWPTSSTAYHFTEAEQDATLTRDQRLQAVGYAVLHVKPRQVRDDPDGFVRIVLAWLAALDARSA